jgi:hypothetical protein
VDENALFVRRTPLLARDFQFLGISGTILLIEENQAKENHGTISMIKKCVRGIVLMLVAAGLTSCISPHPSAAQSAVPDQALLIGLGQKGLTSLQYHGDNLLADGALSVQTVTLKRAVGATVQGSTVPVSSAYDPALRRLVETFPWGTIACRYTPVGSRLNLAVAVTNTSSQTIQQLTLQILAVHFPSAPKGWVPNDVHIGSNTGDPTVITADYGSGEIAVCNEDVAGKPLLVGFPGRADFSSRPIVFSTAPGWVLSPYLDNYLARPIAPGATDIYHVSLRFGPSGSSETALAGDLLARFAHAYPQTLHWQDHRAIGTLHLAASETNLHSATNPRGWFADKSVDVITPAGIAAFQKRVLAYADASVVVLKKMNAQGMITWDLEGEQYPQSTTYIGDPRLLKTLDPEMDKIVDAYFQKFRAAGLRTGLCIRPQRLKLGPGTAEQEEIADPNEVVQLLYDKMAYANKRWGCTLFYVDSNGDPNVPYDPAIFQKLTQKLALNGINALVMPEHKNMRYYAYTAPYAELRLGVTSTPDFIRAVYPQAFTDIYAPDGPMTQDHKTLVSAVQRGDILLFRAWWDDSQNAQVQSLYHDAGK